MPVIAARVATARCWLSQRVAVPTGIRHSNIGLLDHHHLGFVGRGRISFDRPFRVSRLPSRPLFVPGSAEARGAVKAIRFRAARVQLHACGVLRTACDSPAFPPRP